jgi:lysophospholipase L1-like esterase
MLVASSCELLWGCTSAAGIRQRGPSAAIDSSDRSKAREANQTAPAESPRWIHSWVSAQQLVESHNHPPAPGLLQATLRQRILLTLGGPQLRFRFSNEYGNSSLEIHEASVALPHIGATLKSESRAVTFGGKPSTLIAPGHEHLSDPVEMPIASQTELAVTVRFGSVPSDLTGHPGSRTTSFMAHGESSDARSFTQFQATEHWYFLSGVEVKTTPRARALVILGDSITDGRGSTTDNNNRYANVLARRLLQNEATRHMAVLNQGIGGNRVLSGGLGPTILERYQRDALSLPGTRWLMLLCGINDLGALHDGKETPPSSACRLIEALGTIARDARRRNARVYGSTLLPYEGSFYFTQQGETERQKFNDWIRSNTELDAFVDFDRITRDPAHPARLRPEVDGGDHLHPSANGHALMGEAVPLSLFTE